MSKAPKPLPEGIRLHALVEHCEKRVQRAQQRLADIQVEHERAIGALRSAREGRAEWAKANPQLQEEMF